MSVLNRTALLSALLALTTGACDRPRDQEPVQVPAAGLVAQPGPDELSARRTRLAEALGEGVVLIRARHEEKEMEQPSWIQDPAFFYFTGLLHAPGAFLVIEASEGAATLYVPPPPRSFGMEVTALDLAADSTLGERTGITRIAPSAGFKADVTALLLRTSGGPIWLDGPRFPEPTGVPDDMTPVGGNRRLWETSVRAAFPGVDVRSAGPEITRLRWAKSASEIAQLRHNARLSAVALAAGMRAVGPGVTQRRAEAAVVAGCLEAGAVGPSFWPWMAAGENAHFPRLVRSFFDYSGLDRTMEPGELVRADIGCMAGGYGGDVGRTVPVSGAFSASQAALWDLLVVGYRAGISAMKPGVPLDSVRSASRRAIAEAAVRDTALAPVAAVLNGQPGVDWHLHGVGIESGESPGGPLVEGAVIAYEPMFVLGPDAYYLEDMILVTPDGPEILTLGLPTTAGEIGAFLTRR